MQPLLAYNTWLALPKETRVQLEKLFNIPKTGESIVRMGGISPEGNIAGEVTSDGHTAKDLYAITIEKMQELTGSDSDNFYHLFKMVVDNVEELSTSIEPIHVKTATPNSFVPLPRNVSLKKRGRPAKIKHDGESKED